MPTKYDGVMVGTLLPIDEYEKFKALCDKYGTTPETYIYAMILHSIDTDKQMVKENRRD